MASVIILNMTHPRELETKIEQGLEKGYKLVGPVTTCVRLSGDVIYTATLIREEK